MKTWVTHGNRIYNIWLNHLNIKLSQVKEDTTLSRVKYIQTALRADPRSMLGADTSRPDRVSEPCPGLIPAGITKRVHHAQGWSQQASQNKYTMPRADPSRHQRTVSHARGWSLKHQRTVSHAWGWSLRHQRTSEPNNWYSKKTLHAIQIYWGYKN